MAKNCPRYLVDSGIIMRELRGMSFASRELRGYARLGGLAISSITRLEVHAGMRPEHRYVTGQILGRYPAISLDPDIADRAGDIIRLQRSRGIMLGVGDAVIAATALSNGLTLITLNRRDFESIPGLSLAPLGADLI